MDIADDIHRPCVKYYNIHDVLPGAQLKTNLYLEMGLFENGLCIKHDGIDARELLEEHHDNPDRQGLVDAWVLEIRPPQTASLQSAVIIQAGLKNDLKQS